MTWIILEGIDRSGKSTVAEAYKADGYEVIHFSAPDKKFSQEGYTGPSYLDEILDLLVEKNGKDVVWDRSWYGEMVWPAVYNRKPLLSEDDFEVIQDFESRNSANKILMIDPDAKGHWKRCVDNKEPLNSTQFTVASRIYNQLAHKQNFMPRELKDFHNVLAKTENNKQADTNTQQDQSNASGQPKAPNASAKSASDNKAVKGGTSARQNGALTEVEKLEKANAINEILTSRLIKKQGPAFEKLESDIKAFLQEQLSSIFNGGTTNTSLTSEDVAVVKMFVQRLKDKESNSTQTRK